MVNQQYIAERLDVSVATVSRALRSNSATNPRTRAKVLELASKLGYRLPERTPRFSGRLSNENQVSLIGVMIRVNLDADVARVNKKDTEVSTYVVAGMSEAAHRMKMSLVVHHVPAADCENIDDPEMQPEAMRRRMLAGVVLIHPFPPETVRRLAEQLPCVTIINPILGARIDCVGSDQLGAIAAEMDHLYRLGHRRTGFVMVNRKGNPWNQTRFGAYVASLNRLGLQYDPSFVVGLEGYRATPTEIDAIIAQIEQGVRAWACVGDDIGYDLYMRLTERGLRVPQDVSITGFDSSDPPHGCPKLTSVRPPFEQIGVAAVRRLLNRIKHPSAPQVTVQYACELVEGATTGPPVGRTEFGENR